MSGLPKPRVKSVLHAKTESLPKPRVGNSKPTLVKKPMISLSNMKRGAAGWAAKLSSSRSNNAAEERSTAAAAATGRCRICQAKLAFCVCDVRRTKSDMPVSRKSEKKAAAAAAAAIEAHPDATVKAKPAVTDGDEELPLPPRTPPHERRMSRSKSQLELLRANKEKRKSMDITDLVVGAAVTSPAVNAVSAPAASPAKAIPYAMQVPKKGGPPESPTVADAAAAWETKKSVRVVGDNAAALPAKHDMRNYQPVRVSQRLSLFEAGDAGAPGAAYTKSPALGGVAVPKAEEPAKPQKKNPPLPPVRADSLPSPPALAPALTPPVGDAYDEEDEDLPVLPAQPEPEPEPTPEPTLPTLPTESPPAGSSWPVPRPRRRSSIRGAEHATATKLPQKTKAPPPRPPPPSRAPVRQSDFVSQQDQDELARQLAAAEQAAVESIARQETEEEAECAEMERLHAEIAVAEAEAAAAAKAEAEVIAAAAKAEAEAEALAEAEAEAEAIAAATEAEAEAEALAEAEAEAKVIAAAAKAEAEAEALAEAEAEAEVIAAAAKAEAEAEALAEAEAEAEAIAAAAEAEAAAEAAVEAAAEIAAQAEGEAIAAATEAETAAIAAAREREVAAPPVPVAAPRPQPRPRQPTKKAPPPPPSMLARELEPAVPEQTSLNNVRAALPPTKKAPPPPPNRVSSIASAQLPTSLPPKKKAPPPRPPSIVEPPAQVAAASPADKEPGEDVTANDLFPDVPNNDKETVAATPEVGSAVVEEGEVTADDLFPDMPDAVDEDDEVAKLEAEIAAAEVEAAAEASIALEGATTESSETDQHTSRDVTLSTAEGRSIGMQLRPRRADGCGLVVNSCDEGGQAEATGQVFPEDVITHVNGADVLNVPMGEIATLIKEKDVCIIRLATAAVADVEMPREVTLQTSNNQTVGMQLKPKYSTGCGLCVLGVDLGGQAEANGNIFAGDEITHVNGVDISKMQMVDIAKLITSNDTCDLRLVAGSMPAAQMANDEDDESDTEYDNSMVEQSAPPTGDDIDLQDENGQKLESYLAVTTEEELSSTEPKSPEKQRVDDAFASSDDTDDDSDGGGANYDNTQYNAGPPPGNPPPRAPAPPRAPQPSAAPPLPASELQRDVVLSTANGQSVGMQLKPRTVEGCGLVVHACDEGGQAEATGQVFPEDVITHVNGADVLNVPMGEIAKLIKEQDTCTLRMAVSSAASPPPLPSAPAPPLLSRDVVLSTANGQSVGMQLKPRTVEGCGLVVHACDEGGQAEATGQVFPEDVITHVNGADVLNVPMGEIAKLIKEQDTCVLTLSSSSVASAANEAVVVTRRVSQILTVYENEGDDADDGIAPKAKGHGELNETVRLMNLLMDGAWFVKEAKKYGKSRKRFFVLEPGQATLRYYAKFEEGKPSGPKGFIELTRDSEIKVAELTSLIVHTETREWKLTAEQADVVLDWKAGVQMVVDGLRAVGGVVDQVSAKVNPSVMSPLSSGRMSAFTDKAKKAAYRKSSITQPVEESFNHVVSVSSEEITISELPEVVTPPPMVIAVESSIAPTAVASATPGDVDESEVAGGAPAVPLAPAFSIPPWIAGKVPVSFRQCIAFLAQPAVLKEEGLFRVSGNKTTIQQYDKAFDDGQSDVLRTCFEPATVCGLLKLRMKSYKTPCDGQGAKLLETAIVIGETEGLSVEERIQATLEILEIVGEAKAMTLQAVVTLLGTIVLYPGSVMTFSNVGISLGPSMFPSVSVQGSATMVQFLYEHRSALWPSIDFSGSLNAPAGTGFTMSATPLHGGSVARDGEEEDGGDSDPEYAAERAALQSQMNMLSADVGGITASNAEENPYDMMSDSNTPYGEPEPEPEPEPENVAAAGESASPVPSPRVRTF